MATNTTQAATANKVDVDDELQKLLTKYKDDPSGFAKGYRELERKMTSQGQELGTLRKQTEDYEQAVKQYTAVASQWKPIVDWYNANYQSIQQMYANNASNANANAAVQQQAAQAAAQTPGFEWMTPAEKQALTNAVATNLTQTVLQPWTRQFAQGAEKWADDRHRSLQESFAKQQQAAMDVLWRTFERIVPKEKLDEARQFHQEALRFADPKKLNPMELANETLSAKSQLAQMSDELNSLKREKEAREKAQTTSLGAQSSSSLFQSAEAATPSTDPGDRFAKVMETVQREHGADALRDTFPALR